MSWRHRSRDHWIPHGRGHLEEASIFNGFRDIQWQMWGNGLRDLKRPLNNLRSFWYQSISHIRLPTGYKSIRQLTNSVTRRFGDRAPSQGRFDERLGRFGNTIRRFVDYYTNSVTVNVTFALGGRTVYPQYIMSQTDDRRTQHCSISATPWPRWAWLFHFQTTELSVWLCKVALQLLIVTVILASIILRSGIRTTVSPPSECNYTKKAVLSQRWPRVARLYK